MNSNWHSFLNQRQLSHKGSIGLDFDNDTSEVLEKAICPILDTGVLAVKGKDASSFLQGQITCDIEKVTESSSNLGAACNPKGRVFTTFRVLKHQCAYYLLLPLTLLPAFKKRLQMYILRSDVTLEDMSDKWCLMGIFRPRNEESFLIDNLSMPTDVGQVCSSSDSIAIKLQSSAYRYLLIADAEKAQKFWSFICRVKHHKEYTAALWKHQNILDGIPELNEASSEAFVPQMLNLDLLGGISFNKGCYTGQEVVARMHYLGKLKSRMYRATCKMDKCPEPGRLVYDGENSNNQSVGKIVICSSIGEKTYLLLIVMQTASAKSDQLRIQIPDGDPLKIFNFPYTSE